MGYAGYCVLNWSMKSNYFETQSAPTSLNFETRAARSCNYGEIGRGRVLLTGYATKTDPITPFFGQISSVVWPRPDYPRQRPSSVSSQLPFGRAVLAPAGCSLCVSDLRTWAHFIPQGS